MRALDHLPRDVEVLFDEEGEVLATNGTLYPFRVLGFKQGMEQVGLTFGVQPADVFTLGVQAAIKAHALEKAKQITDTTKAVLKEKLQEVLDNGDSVAAFAKTIRDTFDGFGKNRSITVARTEITGSVNYGANETLRSEGYREREWSAVGDDRTRDTHLAADGQTVPIGEPFRVGGASGMYPGDPMLPPGETVNCRCTVLGTGVPDDRKAPVIAAYLRAHGALERRLVVSLRRTFAAQRDRILSRLAP